MPSFVGNNSCAYKSMAGNADESMNPEQKLSITVIVKPTCGIRSEKGAVPSIDTHITSLRP